jgi:hypothetical protein
MTDNPLDSSDDPFGPPEVSVEVECLHCGQQYDSYLIEWRIETDAEGKQHGFWCCPTPDCDGKGFGFDIFPTDPDYRDERGGWVYSEEDDDEYDEEDFAADELGGESTSDGPTDRSPHNGNGHGRPKLEDDRSDDIPF